MGAAREDCEDWPMLPVRGAREEEGWRGSSKSLRSAGGRKIDQFGV